MQQKTCKQERLFKKRIAKEIKNLKSNADLRYEYGIDIFKWSKSSDYHYIVVFNGPLDTQYEHGIFFASMTFPKNYPFRAPSIQLLTKVYSPNFSDTGTHAFDYSHWDPSQTIDQYIVRIRSLLSLEFQDVINVDARNLQIRDRAQFDDIAYETTLNFAHGEFMHFHMWMTSNLQVIEWLRDHVNTFVPMMIDFCGCYVIEENVEILYGPISDMEFVSNKASLTEICQLFATTWQRKDHANWILGWRWSSLKRGTIMTPPKKSDPSKHFHFSSSQRIFTQYVGDSWKENFPVNSSQSHGIHRACYRSSVNEITSPLRNRERVYTPTTYLLIKASSNS